MYYFGKIIVLSLVIALVSFTGSFCLHPMVAQAASVDMAMDVLQNGSDANNGECIADSSGEISNTVTCVSDCVTTVPQAVTVKKTSADSLANVLVTISSSEQPQPTELFPSPFYVTDTDPLSPDILSSVVKIE